MVRLTLLLLVAIYAVMVIYSDPVAERDTPVARAPERPGGLQRPDEDALVTTRDGAIVLETATGGAWRIDAVIEPGEVAGQEGVSVVTATGSAAVTGEDPVAGLIDTDTDSAEAVAEPAPAPPPDTAPAPEAVVEAAPADTPADTPTEAPADAAAEAPAAEQAPAAAAAPVRLQVAGDRVNFRAGPSTDTAILVALNRGEVVELIAPAPDGWSQVRVVATGLTGYMSNDFLEPAN